MIRRATKNDTARIVELCKRFYHTTEYIKFAPYNEDTIQILTEQLIATGLVLVACLDGEIVGVAGLVVAPFMFNFDVLTAHEVVYYVEPEAQGMGVGRDLAAAVEPFAKDMGVKAAQLVRLSTSPKQAEMLYNALSYNLTEYVHTKVF